MAFEIITIMLCRTQTHRSLRGCSLSPGRQVYPQKHGADLQITTCTRGISTLPRGDYLSILGASLTFSPRILGK